MFSVPVMLESGDGKNTVYVGLFFYITCKCKSISNFIHLYLAVVECLLACNTAILFPCKGTCLLAFNGAELKISSSGPRCA